MCYNVQDYKLKEVCGYESINSQVVCAFYKNSLYSYEMAEN